MNFSRLWSPEELTQHRLLSVRAGRTFTVFFSGSRSLTDRMQSRAIPEVDQMK